MKKKQILFWRFTLILIIGLGTYFTIKNASKNEKQNRKDKKIIKKIIEKDLELNIRPNNFYKEKKDKN